MNMTMGYRIEKGPVIKGRQTFYGVCTDAAGDHYALDAQTRQKKPFPNEEDALAAAKKVPVRR
jgi:hypothetical protein